MNKITRRLAERTKKLISEQGIDLELDPSAISYLAEKGYNEEYGARPLRRLIQQELEDVLAEKIIRQDIEKGDKVLVKADKNGLLVDVKKQAEVKVGKK